MTTCWKCGGDGCYCWTCGEREHACECERCGDLDADGPANGAQNIGECRECGGDGEQPARPRP